MQDNTVLGLSGVPHTHTRIWSCLLLARFSHLPNTPSFSHLFFCLYLWISGIFFCLRQRCFTPSAVRSYSFEFISFFTSPGHPIRLSGPGLENTGCSIWRRLSAFWIFESRLSGWQVWLVGLFDIGGASFLLGGRIKGASLLLRVLTCFRDLGVGGL